MIKEYVQAYPEKKVMIFTETKVDAKAFGNLNYGRFVPIHGDLEQNQRTRILNEFRRPQSNSILVATDVAARGLDIEDIDCVFQFDIRRVDSFIHRAGRTGRKGKDGLNVVFLSRDKLSIAKDCEQQLKIQFDYSNSIISADGEEAEDLKQIALADAVTQTKQLISQTEDTTSVLDIHSDEQVNELMQEFNNQSDEQREASMRRIFQGILSRSVYSHKMFANRYGLVSSLPGRMTFHLEIPF